jgi:hypothetical protein
MTDFEVVFNYKQDGSGMTGISKVYWVDVRTNEFLIADPWGKFRWISANRCTLRETWEVDNGPLFPEENAKEET